LAENAVDCLSVVVVDGTDECRDRHTACFERGGDV
jgi:hypothetical protein